MPRKVCAGRWSRGPVVTLSGTRPEVLKSAKCRFESDWGHSRRAYSSAVASLSLPRAILGLGAERLSSRADVVSGRIEQQRDR